MTSCQFLEPSILVWTSLNQVHAVWHQQQNNPYKVKTSFPMFNWFKCLFIQKCLCMLCMFICIQNQVFLLSHSCSSMSEYQSVRLSRVWLSANHTLIPREWSQHITGYKYALQSHTQPTSHLLHKCKVWKQYLSTVNAVHVNANSSLSLIMSTTMHNKKRMDFKCIKAIVRCIIIFEA